ncbi:MAG: M20/M25/M40 family metallo-hydrolase [Myxococcaceae bacterium]
MNVTNLTLALCEIPSTTGEEQALTNYVSDYLKQQGYEIKLQEVSNRHNLLAVRPGITPQILLTTHLDTVPPHIPPVLESGILKGRGVCDAKGIMAAMICAAKDLPEVGLLFLVGEETNSDGAKAAALGFAPKVSYFINGEPTDLKVASAMKGALAFELETSGTTGHSAYPETGHSAIHQLSHDIHILLTHDWPKNTQFGETTLNIGKLEGGRAANVIADHAKALCVMRTTIEHLELEKQIAALLSPSTKLKVLTASSPLLFEAISGFETCVVRFGSDVPHLKSIGTPVLLGPGSILHAHTAQEQISVAELEQSVVIYEKLCRQLIGN